MATNLRKYPRTQNVPWSGSESSDDVWLKDCGHFLIDGKPKEVIVTEKLDGENTNMYPDHIHARSMDGGNGPGRSWVKQLHGRVKHDIPAGWRISGENVYAAHSIWYWGLETYFYVFAVFDEENRCLDWDDVTWVCDLLGLHTAPLLYRGPYDEKLIRSMWTGKSHFETYETPKDHKPVENPVPTTGEGYVIRSASDFAFQEFSRNVSKYVRSQHVQTDAHWMDLPVLPNRLAI